MGAAIASHSDSRIVRSIAENSSVQRHLGHMAGKAASSRTVQKHAGELVASKAEDEEFQRKMIDGTKAGAKAGAKGAAHGVKAGASFVASNY